ncbi:hypothetical protein H4W81_006012 [Nonomuraea africana]|uniref:Uncharacterized protein n=1 Tax=Nonomuraea africana TaxID=46171 RepID=A0ABR9KNR0_9ACTN|nr:hypothetical protein [Nonomuraea africana]
MADISVRFLTGLTSIFEIVGQDRPTRLTMTLNREAGNRQHIFYLQFYDVATRIMHS